MQDIDMLLAEQLGYVDELNWQEWIKLQEELEVVNG